MKIMLTYIFFLSYSSISYPAEVPEHQETEAFVNGSPVMQKPSRKSLMMQLGLIHC